jgi:uncharacterized protein
MQRITNLDFIRGVSVLGILIMNSLTFILHESAYFNHPSSGVDGTFDWLLVFFSEIFISQKMMGLFSILFGAGIVLFIESAINKDYKNPILLSFWRVILLFIFGTIHAVFWDGDILRIYALSALIIFFLYKRNTSLLIFLSVFFTLISSVLAFIWQPWFDSQGNLIQSAALTTTWTDNLGLSTYWFQDSTKRGEAIYSYFGIDALFRAIGMMLLGVVLYRMNVLSGKLDIRVYKRMAIFGLVIGIPLGILSLVWLQARDYSPEIAIIGFVPNKLGIIPLVMAYIGILSILNNKVSSKLILYIRACGKMAFTNYITQTVLCLIFLGSFFEQGGLTRKEIILFVFLVWTIQILWSKLWLDKFDQGPLEYLWRRLTYSFFKQH